MLAINNVLKMIISFEYKLFLVEALQQSLKVIKVKFLYSGSDHLFTYSLNIRQSNKIHILYLFL